MRGIVLGSKVVQRHVNIMSHWLFNVYMDAVMKELKMGMGRREGSGECLASCMHMTWFCVMGRRKT